MRVLAIAVGALLLLLGSGNAVLAMTVETCTGGEADSLNGGIVTLALYALGFGALARGRSKGAIGVAAALPALAAIWHSVFAGRFLFGYLSTGMTSCQAMLGLPYGADGREIFHLGLWLATSLIFWLGLVLALRFAEPAIKDA